MTEDKQLAHDLAEFRQLMAQLGPEHTREVAGCLVVLKAKAERSRNK